MNDEGGGTKNKADVRACLENFKGVRIYLIPLALLAAVVLLRSDVLSYIKWWLALLGLGLIFFPLTALIFRNFNTKGYILAKVIGLAVSGYSIWFLASFRILPFRLWAVYLILALFLALNCFIAKKSKVYSAVFTDKNFLRKMFPLEALFMVLLAYWSYLRGLRPDINNTLEMFMDFGFMNSVLRSDYFPPLDMWFAREPINYYYLGQYFSGYLTKISGVDSAVAYNLMIATLFSVSFMEAFSIGQMLLQIFRENTHIELHKCADTVCGLLSGALVCLSGSLHTIIYAWIVREPNSFGSTDYWFPDATRYIGFNPPVPNDETIHEFPLYSFIVSDLHAHVINMIFVLTVIAAAAAVCAGIMAKLKENRKTDDLPKSGWLTVYYRLTEYCPLPAFLLIIFLIGLFPAANFWDFPIYLVVTAGLYFYANLKRYDYKIKSVAITAAMVIITGLAAYAVVYLPFQTRFDPISTEIKTVTAGSRLYQLLVLYGYQACFFVMLLVEGLLARKAAVFYGVPKKAAPHKKAKYNDKLEQKESDFFYIPARDRQRPVFWDFIEKLNPADAIVLILFVCAFGLIIIPEIIYVKDIYPGAPRANTMFKLCYQAFIMLALGVGYTYPRLYLTRVKGSGRTSFQHAAAVFLLFCAFLYPFYAVGGWYGSQHFSNYKGLDGIKYMPDYEEKLGEDALNEAGEVTEAAPFVRLFEDDYDIVGYIRKNVKGQPTIAEANDRAYTRFGRIASYTGLPDIFNWYSHQQLWRGEHFEAFNERVNDVAALYTSDDRNAVNQVIEKYDVRYIVVGKLERYKFKDVLNEPMLRGLGEIIFQKGDSYLIEIRN
ncbi:MAG: DUF2298 domain-containing protein [Clostridiales bacterium]|jgi:YYY domain-containing protein|nr:DUF2298 domain-containing protein [Clostridiales bacterium]